MGRNNKVLYKKIMNNISQSIKKILLENRDNFDITDYEDTENDIVDYGDIKRLLIKKPKNLEEEFKLFRAIVPSQESISITDKFVKKLKNILNPLENKNIRNDILNYFNENLQGYNFEIIVEFSIESNFIQENVVYKYTDISFVYNFNDLDNFVFKCNIDILAQMIEFCYLYKNPINACIYINGYIMHKKFRKKIMAQNIYSDPMYIYPLGQGPLPKYSNNVYILFENIFNIYQEFVDFILEEIKTADTI